MINADDEVQLAYLLDPSFQLVNTSGKPLTGGWLEVYLHGTRTKYYCYSDWNGSLHPFKIPLDSLGANVVLASPAHSYDIYIYNKYGTLVMSRYNVVPSTGDGTVIKGVVNITSDDGTVLVDTTNLPNSNQYDLSVNTDIIATNEYVYAQVGEEAKSRSHEDELIRDSIPTKTSQLDNDSGFLTNTGSWIDVQLTNTNLNNGECYLSINPVLRLCKCQLTFKLTQSVNKGGWYDMATFTPINTSTNAVQCSMDTSNDHNRYLLGRIVLSEGKIQLYAFDGSINSNIYINVVGWPSCLFNY